MAAASLDPGIFRALANAKRVRLLRALAHRAHTPAELARRLSLPESTVRHNLKVLVDAHLVTRRQDDRVWAYHVLTDTGRAVAAGEWRGALLPLVPGLGLVAAAAFAFTEWWQRRPRIPEAPPGMLPAPLAPDPLAPAYFTAGVAFTLGALLLLALAVAWRLAFPRARRAQT